ncbi:MAG: hypothetical protein LW860_06990 [Xanthomonadaceae bacterium]|jgi:hypothetical protein|nr:hypothetical protein [Xanthomonadaceae bacterium]
MNAGAILVDRVRGETYATPDEIADRFEALVITGELARMAKDDPAQYAERVAEAEKYAKDMMGEAAKLAAAALRMDQLGHALAAQVRASRG